MRRVSTRGLATGAVDEPAALLVACGDVRPPVPRMPAPNPMRAGPRLIRYTCAPASMANPPVGTRVPDGADGKYGASRGRALPPARRSTTKGPGGGVPCACTSVAAHPSTTTHTKQLATRRGARSRWVNTLWQCRSAAAPAIPERSARLRSHRCARRRRPPWLSAPRDRGRRPPPSHPCRHRPPAA